MTETLTIDPKRLARIKTLKSGGHRGITDGACVMEAVAYVAGEIWSDHPACACPVITEFLVSWNDALPDDERTELLKPLIPLVVGTRGSKALEARRANMAADWFIRVQTPAWLRLAGLTKQAETLEAFPEITDFAKVPSLMPTLQAIRKDSAAAGVAAGDVAGDVAGDAAGAAAWAAAGDAARDVARDAAWAAALAAARVVAGDVAGDVACDVAGDVAWDAARAAARVVARAAARDALKPTTTALQASAVDLVKRMCTLSDADLEPTA